MNKYQDALDRVKEIYKNICDEFNLKKTVVKMNEDVEVLQELVDKATPKKPIITIINKEYGSYQCDCPDCGRFISVNCKDITTVYCPECGKRIDWSDEDE